MSFHIPAHKSVQSPAAQAEIPSYRRVKLPVDRYDVTSAIIAYEADEMDVDDTIELFQHLLDSGMVWQLQGSYGRMADRLIKAGFIN
jgi:hypothetical protein